jgi:membrane-associated phospholipid phosphatase
MDFKLLFGLPERQKNSYWRVVTLSLICVLILSLGVPLVQTGVHTRIYVHNPTDTY